MSYTVRDKARFVHELTGYTMKDCLVVLQAAEAFDMQAFRNNEAVKYGKLFTVEPYKIPERNRYDINTQKVAVSRSHYALRVKLHKMGEEVLDEIEDE